MDNDLLIEKISEAIKIKSSQLRDMESEHEKIIDILRSARWIDYDYINLIDKRYNDKISASENTVRDMRDHLAGLQEAK